MAENSSYYKIFRGHGSSSPPSEWTPPSELIELDPDETRGPLEFYLGRRLVTATTAERIDPLRTVYRLKVQKPSILDYVPILSIRSMFEAIFNHYPYLKTLFPEWFLPLTVIIKKRKPDWEKEFEGEAIYDGSPALVLSEIIGQRLSDLTRRPVDDKNLERKLEEVYKALTKYGVAHRDAALHNVIDVGDRFVVIDLEQSTIEGTEWEGSSNWGHVGDIMHFLQLNRHSEDEKRQREEKEREKRAERRR